MNGLKVNPWTDSVEQVRRNVYYASELENLHFTASPVGANLKKLKKILDIVSEHLICNYKSQIKKIEFFPKS